MPPIQTPESARLNTGQMRKSKKSITNPNLNRSIRLPKAPPKINPKQNLSLNDLRAFFLSKKIITKIIIKEIMIKRECP